MNSKSFGLIYKNIFYLATGGIFSKILIFVAYIIIANCLTKSDYGLFLTAWNAILILSVISSMGLDLALIREGARDEKVLIKVFSLGFVLRLIGFLLACCITMLSFLLVRDRLSLEVWRLVFLLLPLLIIGGFSDSGLISHVFSYFKSKQLMSKVSMYLLVRSVLFLILVSFVCYFQSVYLVVFAMYFSSVFILIFILKREKCSCLSFNLKFIIENINLIKELFKISLLFGIVSVMYSLMIKIDIQMLAVMKGLKDVAVYGVAWQVVTAGLIFVNAISMSFFPNTAKYFSERSYLKKFAFIITLISLSLCIFILVLLKLELHKLAIKLIFGEKYIISSKVLEILLWFIPLRLVGIWGTQVLEAKNKLGMRIIIFLVPLVLNVVLNYLFIPKFGTEGAAIASVLSILILAVLSNSFALFLIKFSRGS